MASGYPASIDALATNKSDSTAMATDHATHHNDLADAVNKIEGELGVNPSGASATVKARLDTLLPTPGAWTAYTPSIGGSGWNIGDATVAGFYCRLGKIVFIKGQITFGSTSVYGAGGLLLGGSPVLSRSTNGALPSANGWIVDTSIGARWSAFFSRTSGTEWTARHLNSNSNIVDTTSSAPMTWASGDVLAWAFWYESD